MAPSAAAVIQLPQTQGSLDCVLSLPDLPCYDTYHRFWRAFPLHSRCSIG